MVTHRVAVKLCLAVFHRLEPLLIRAALLRQLLRSLDQRHKVLDLPRARRQASGHRPGHPERLVSADVVVVHEVEGDGMGVVLNLLGESAGKPVTAEMAVRLAKMFGGSAESWIRMQAAYDAWHAERAVDVSNIPRLEAAE